MDGPVLCKLHVIHYFCIDTTPIPREFRKIQHYCVEDVENWMWIELIKESLLEILDPSSEWICRQGAAFKR